MLAAELRQWVAEKKLALADLLFTVPTGLRRILDRDMQAAGIPKRDERGRTVDVHAMRTTFATMLSTSGTAPRTHHARAVSVKGKSTDRAASTAEATRSTAWAGS